MTDVLAEQQADALVNPGWSHFLAGRYLSRVSSDAEA